MLRNEPQPRGRRQSHYLHYNKKNKSPLASPPPTQHLLLVCSALSWSRAKLFLAEMRCSVCFSISLSDWKNISNTFFFRYSTQHLILLVSHQYHTLTVMSSIHPILDIFFNTCFVYLNIYFSYTFNHNLWSFLIHEFNCLVGVTPDFHGLSLKYQCLSCIIVSVANFWMSK